MHFKDKPEYTHAGPDFKPLPKYGHLSKPTPEFLAARDAIDAGNKALWGIPDVTTLREMTPDVDAQMPPGGPDRQNIMTERIYFDARDGHKVELKIYKAGDVQPDAVLMVRMHGGGWMVGGHEVDGIENVYAAAESNIVVASIDYRMAPEYPFPTPLHDCYDGLIWCKNNATTLGIDPEKIIVAGGSAGGNLAACLVLEARNEGVTGIMAQVLSFPIICHPKFFPVDKYEFGSYMQNANASVLNAVCMELALDTYIPDAKPDPRHSPLLASSHKDLPPTLIQCGGCDPLRDEAFAYAEALKNAGVVVEVHGYKGLPHWFAGVLLTAPETSVFYDRYTNFLRRCTGKESVNGA
ncbi:hypothetical protein FDECE_4874 [Fusarium decemcellulare]|nr:hypothetical protein FDECE_4874 [Fusarium decemcellulare]